MSALAAACLMSVALGGPARACQLLQVAEMPATMQGDEPLVDVALNGRPVRFLVDTDNAWSFLTPAAVQQLGLKPVSGAEVTSADRRSLWVVSRARVREFRLGSLVAHDTDIMVANQWKSKDFAGLLGRDFLLNRYDLELDLAHHVIRLFEPKDCHGDEVAYWAKAYSQASIFRTRLGISAEATLDGRRVSALLSSGASNSIVSLNAARTAGVTLQSHAIADAGKSAGGGGGTVRTGTFQTLGVGDEIVRNAEVEVSDLKTDQDAETGSNIKDDVVELPEIILGADFLEAHHVYIALSQGKMYFTYNGGRIFDVPPVKAGRGAAKTGG